MHSEGHLSALTWTNVQINYGVASYQPSMIHNINEIKSNMITHMPGPCSA